MECGDYRHEIYQHCPTCLPDKFAEDLARAPQPEAAPPAIPPRRSQSDPRLGTGYSDTY
jgi:hypothetical protein